MASRKNRSRGTTTKDTSQRRFRKKTSVLTIDKVDYVDYKDVDLLNRFISDRAKIRNRRVSGNDVQQQREVANAIKVAREMALIPYTRRVSSQRTRPPRDGDRFDRGGNGRGRDGRPDGNTGRDADAATTAVSANEPSGDGDVVDVVVDTEDAGGRDDDTRAGEEQA